jgi:hypothetical protein
VCDAVVIFYHPFEGAFLEPGYGATDPLQFSFAFPERTNEILDPI